MKKSEFREMYKMMFSNYPDVVTVPQMQKMLHVSKPTAYNLINDGYIKCVKMGGTYRIPKICIINYVLEESEGEGFEV